MKKSLFFLLLPFLCLSCSSSVVYKTLEEDKKTLFSVEEKDYVLFDEYFSSSYSSKKTESGYEVEFVLGDVKTSFSKVRLLLTNDKEHAYFLGYSEKEYNLVPKSEKKDETRNIYYGVKIHFLSEKEVDHLSVLFQSVEKSICYRL